MGRPKGFKYYLRYDVSGTKHYYYVDTNGDVQSTTTKTQLQFAPKGWRDKSLKWERGFVYHGIFQTFTIPLEFVKDGAKILRYLHVNYGTEAECEFYIEKWNGTIAVFDYEPYYYGDIDFSRFNSRQDFVNSEVMEGGFMAKLKAKETTDYEIPITDSPFRIWVNMDGIIMLAVFTMIGIEQPLDLAPPTYVASTRENFPTLLYAMTEGITNGDHNPKGNEFIALNQQMFSQTYAGVADKITVNSSDKWIIHNTSSTQTYTYNLKGRFQIDHQNTAVATRTTNLYLYVNNASAPGTSVTKYTLATGGTIPGLGTLSETISFDYDIVLQPNEQLWFFFRHTGVIGEVLYHLDKFDMQISVFNRSNQSYIPALRNFIVGEILIDNINTGTALDSDLLELDEIQKVLTSGDAIRGIEKAQLKTNYEDYYKSNRALHNTSMLFDKPNNTVFIKRIQDAYDEATQILDLGDVSNFTHYPLTGEMFAKLKIGYPDIKFDDVNGKEEFNILHRYQSPLIRVTTEKDLTSVYHASMYEIEIARANLTGKTQADNESDNTVFWLDIEPTASGTVPVGLPGAGEDYYNLNRSGYSVTAGLAYPNEAFNLYLSPKLMLFRHGNWINSVLHPQFDLNGNITFQTSSKTQNDNEFLIWNNGSVINEKQTEALQDLAAAIIYPIIFEFDSIIPQNILSILESNPYGKVRFESNGLEYFGFILSMQDEPVTKPKQTYKLLCSVSTDLNNLIS